MQGNVDSKVLVQEVATRHDEIVKLKNENLSLEEQMKRQDKNIVFKDQIIKELRKDCKKVSAVYSDQINFITQTLQIHSFFVP